MKRYKLLALLLTAVATFFLTSCFVWDNPTDGPNDNQGDTAYSFISEGELGEWQEGIIDENGYYLVAKKDEATGFYMAYFSQKENEESDGVLFYFDEDYNISTMVTQKGLCNISRDNTANKALLTVYLANGEISMEEVDYSYFTNNPAQPTNPVGEGVLLLTQNCC